MTHQDTSITAEVDRRFDELFGEEDPDDTITGVETPVESSPLFALKSAVLAVDWEISDEILAKFSEEVNNASRELSGFKKARSLLKLLDSLARYIQRRKGGAHPESIKRLHSVYEALELIVTEPSLTRARINAIVANEVDGFRELKQSISHYHPRNRPEDEEPAEPEPVEERGEREEREEPTAKEDLRDTLPYKDVEALLAEVEARFVEPPAEVGPPAVTVIPETPKDGEIARLVGEEQLVFEEGDLDLHLDDIAPPENLSEMSPHEAFALALEEIRKTIRAEFSALRAELKMWRLEKK